MSTVTETLRTRRRRWWFLIVLGLLLGIVGLVGERARRQDVRRAAIADEVLKAGGLAEQPKSLYDTVRYVRSQGHFPTRRSYVNLTEVTFDNDWIRRHEYLRDFEIRILQCDSITGDDLAKLIDAHPLEALDADDIELTPEVLRAIRDKTTLTQVMLGKSRYGDEQLAELPLERMSGWHLAQTGVTPKGVLLLRRCPNLRSLTLDGSQLTDEVAEALRSFSTVAKLFLVGQEVDDECLQSLHDLTSLRTVYLQDTATTPEGRARLATSLPNCQIEIIAEGK